MTNKNNPEHNTAVISISPIWCDLIMNGQKTMELRKRNPKNIIGNTLYVYKTFPYQYVVGTVFAQELVVENIYDMYSHYNQLHRVDFKNFFDYFGKNNTAYGIKLTNVINFKSPKSLFEICGKSKAPQSYFFGGHE